MLCSIAGFAQNLQVSDPKLELRDNIIYITYDILNSTPSDAFSVELVVKDADGNLIFAGALSGDIGHMVRGGSDKQISWDLGVDKVEINDQIFVKIHVKAADSIRARCGCPGGKEI